MMSSDKSNVKDPGDDLPYDGRKRDSTVVSTNLLSLFLKMMIFASFRSDCIGPSDDWCVMVHLGYEPSSTALAVGIV